MYMMEIPALLFVVIAGCCAKENLDDPSFIFYKISETSKVVVKPRVEKPLDNITFCLQVYTDDVQRDSLFSLQNNSGPQLHLYQFEASYYIEIDKDYVYYKVSRETMEWRLICVSWDSSTGVIHFVVNGKVFPRRVLKRGFVIDPEVTAVLGQSLASDGIGSYRGRPSFVGEMRTIHMWDYALHPKEMKRMCYDYCVYCEGNVISWRSLDYEVHGHVFFYKPN